MSVLNDKPPLTPAKPALTVESRTRICCLRANVTFNCYRAAQGICSTDSIHSDVDLPVVDQSPDSKVRDPPAPELNDPAMKEAMPPTPDNDEPAVNSIEPPSSAPDEFCTNEAAFPTDGTVMHLHLLEPSNCHRQF
jgi:hypothetical protein